MGIEPPLSKIALSSEWKDDDTASSDATNCDRMVASDGARAPKRPPDEHVQASAIMLVISSKPRGDARDGEAMTNDNKARKYTHTHTHTPPGE